MKLYHGSNLIIDAIDLKKCRPFKDFGRGFYLTDIPEQANNMARRIARLYGGFPVINIYETDLVALKTSGLNIRCFDEPDKAWAHFVMNNRDRYFTEIASPECNTDNKYDVVIGPVANDDLALLFRQFSSGLITEDMLIREMRYKKLTNQYSFHSPDALHYLWKAGVLK